MNAENKSSKEELLIDPQLIRKGSLMLRALKHKLRHQMLKLIHEKNKLTVTEIYVALRLEQSVASQHLAILRQSKFVQTEREGKQIFYSINYKRLTEVQQLVENLLTK